MGAKGEFRSTIEGVAARTERGLGGGEAAVEVEAVQLDLIGDPPAGRDVAAAVPQPRRGGRPMGAINRRTTMLKRWYQAKGFRDPAGFLGELVNADPLELVEWFAAHAGTNADGDKLAVPSLFEVVRFQAAVARDLLPYLHSKQPTVVAVPDRVPIFQMIGLDDDGDQVASDAMSIEDAE